MALNQGALLGTTLSLAAVGIIWLFSVLVKLSGSSDLSNLELNSLELFVQGAGLSLIIAPRLELRRGGKAR